MPAQSDEGTATDFGAKDRVRPGHGREIVIVADGSGDLPSLRDEDELIVQEKRRARGDDPIGEDKVDSDLACHSSAAVDEGRLLGGLDNRCDLVPGHKPGTPGGGLPRGFEKDLLDRLPGGCSPYPVKRAPRDIEGPDPDEGDQ